MNAQDPNLSIVELVAHALGSLRSEMVLVGGCAVGLLITDTARPEVRHTIDVDLIAEVASLADYYHRLSPALHERGFVESGEIMCRWSRGGLIVDVMPNKEIWGHSVNRWYEAAVRTAHTHTLPSGQQIQVISAPVFLATKLEAFHGRGEGDYLASTDMADVINVVDGRPELADEVDAADADVRRYLRAEFDELLADENFVDALPGHLDGDANSQARVPLLIERLIRLAGL